MRVEGVTIPGDHGARDSVTALPPATKSPTLYGGRSMPHRGDFMEGAGNQEQGDFRELQIGDTWELQTVLEGGSSHLPTS